MHPLLFYACAWETDTLNLSPLPLHEQEAAMLERLTFLHYLLICSFTLVSFNGLQSLYPRPGNDK